MEEYLNENEFNAILSDMPDKKPETPEVIKKLQYLPIGSLEGEFDSNDDNSSTYDPFESTSKKINTIKALREAQEKFQKLKSKVELINGFSEDMDRNIKNMRRDMKITLQIQYESWDEINKAFKEAMVNPDIPDRLKKDIEEIFEDKKFMNEDEPEISEPVGLLVENNEEEKSEEKAEGDEVDPKNETKEFDHMESVWNMLATSQDMVVSPPNFRADRQKEPHWMNRPMVSWNVIDKSRVKCEEWMDNNSNNFNF